MINGDNAGSFLASVLKCMKREITEPRRFRVIGNSNDPAFFPGFIAVGKSVIWVVFVWGDCISDGAFGEKFGGEFVGLGFGGECRGGFERGFREEEDVGFWCVVCRRQKGVFVEREGSRGGEIDGSH